MHENRLKDLFLIFFRISALTVGGGLSMLPLMEHALVEKHKWLTEDDMIDTVAVVQSMPGIIAVNMAVLAGYKVARIPGVLTASVAVVLPPFLTILIIALSLSKLGGTAALDHGFLGIRAAVCAMIALSTMRLAKNACRGIFPAVIAATAFGGYVFLEWNAVYVIAGAAAAGLAEAYFAVWRAARKRREQA